MKANSLRRLNFRHLYYFWGVAREQNLTRAAECLHVSQSAISTQIRQLEEELGHALFRRSGRALELTEVGHLVLGYAESIFDLGTELLDTLRRGVAQALTELRVGAVATLSRNFQQNLLRPLIGNPSLHLVIESASLEELIERLRVHKLDLVLSNRPVSADVSLPLSCRRIACQTVCLVGPPLPVEKRFSFPDDVAGTALLLPGHNSEVRTQFELLCEGLGLEISVAAEVDDMAMLRLLARDSGRVAVVPEVVVQDELELGLLQKYCELPEVRENFYAITARRHFRSAALKEVLDFG